MALHLLWAPTNAMVAAGNKVYNINTLLLGEGQGRGKYPLKISEFINKVNSSFKMIPPPPQSKIASATPVYC